MAHLTTHILDASQGTPAPGVAVELHDASGLVARAVTDADGRAAVGPDVLAEGDYTLTFATGEYFAAQNVETFYPRVPVHFHIADTRHYHVPLLLSPFAYSTYRGS